MTKDMQLHMNQLEKKTYYSWRHVIYKTILILHCMYFLLFGPIHGQ